MQAIGLHFGHDASGAVLIGRLAQTLDKERRSRVKRSWACRPTTCASCLRARRPMSCWGCAPPSWSRCFMTPTWRSPWRVARRWRAFGRIPADHHYRRLITWRPDFLTQGGTLASGELPYYSAANEGFDQSYEAMGMVGGQTPALSRAMQVEGDLRLDGRAYRARFNQHHYLHAQYAAYAVSLDRPALVISADGGVGPSFAGGGVWTPGQKLQAITPTDGWLGEFYDTVASMLGLGNSGGAGKLMGLAPYGRPILF